MSLCNESCSCKPLDLGCFGVCEEITLDYPLLEEGEHVLEIYNGDSIHCIIIEEEIIIPAGCLRLGKSYLKLLQPSGDYYTFVEECEGDKICINIKQKYQAIKDEEITFTCDSQP